MASGFSHSTWRPLSAAATTRSRWKRFGVATITASTGASFSSANGSAYVRVTPVDGRGLGQRRRVGVAERDDFGITAEPDAGNVIGDGNLAGADESDSYGHMRSDDCTEMESEVLTGDQRSGDQSSDRNISGLCRPPDLLSPPVSCCWLWAPGEEQFDLVSRGHRRLRARAGDRERAGRAGKAYRIIEVGALGERDRERAVEGIAGGRGVDGLHCTGGPRLTPRGGDQARAARAQLHQTPRWRPRASRRRGAAIDPLVGERRVERRPRERRQLRLVGRHQRRQRQQLVGNVRRRRRIEQQRTARARVLPPPRARPWPSGSPAAAAPPRPAAARARRGRGGRA